MSSDTVSSHKSSRLSKEQKAKFTLSGELKEISIGLLLGDLNAQKRNVSTRLRFGQSTKHKEYLYVLYRLFMNYCLTEPRVYVHATHKVTGMIYSSITFQSLSLPCFNELYDLFYLDGRKRVPSDIGSLLTPLGLAYWICDDGSFDKKGGFVVLCTESFTTVEVEVLINVLNSKFDLKCYKSRKGDSYRIVITSDSVLHLQGLLKDIMPSMMLYKIGL